MPQFRRATVTEILSERRGLQRVTTSEGRAYVLTDLIGGVAVDDEVIVNTTAVELGLGTGGWHVVHWNLARDALDLPGPGHIMKLRYTSLQADTGSVEELQAAELAEVASIDDMPVVACGLHSQVPCVAAMAKALRPGIRIAYVMTDGASLPIAMSDLVASMTEMGLIDTTITTGHAFGGDLEAIALPSALAAARRVAAADLAICAMGPGVVGTGSRLGFSAVEVAHVLDTAAALQGRPVACLRYSDADRRARHRGVSHHSLTALELAVSRTTIAVPRGELGTRVREALGKAGLGDQHDLAEADDIDAVEVIRNTGLRVTSMGRGIDDDPAFFAVAGAAGSVGARLAAPAQPRT